MFGGGLRNSSSLAEFWPGRERTLERGSGGFIQLTLRGTLAVNARNVVFDDNLLLFRGSLDFLSPLTLRGVMVHLTPVYKVIHALRWLLIFQFIVFETAVSKSGFVYFPEVAKAAPGGVVVIAAILRRASVPRYEVFAIDIFKPGGLLPSLLASLTSLFD